MRFYGEYGYIFTQDDGNKENVSNFVAPEYKYLKSASYQPFYIGAEYTPSKDCFMSILMSSLYVEWEHINDRQKMHNTKNDMDNWAWTVAWAKKIANSKLQFSVYSGNEISDVGFAFRLTSTIK